jgi:hypothetical protein
VEDSGAKSGIDEARAAVRLALGVLRDVQTAVTRIQEAIERLDDALDLLSGERRPE